MKTPNTNRNILNKQNKGFNVKRKSKTNCNKTPSLLKIRNTPVTDKSGRENYSFRSQSHLIYFAFDYSTLKYL